MVPGLDVLLAAAGLRECLVRSMDGKGGIDVRSGVACLRPSLSGKSVVHVVLSAIVIREVWLSSVAALQPSHLTILSIHLIYERSPPPC